MFLRDFANELEEQLSEELTEKQTTALIKIKNGLILFIEAEISMKEEPRRKLKLLNRFIVN
ncbi:MAG: hypothetical protein ACFFDT_29155 [Candidatus Hodarchaeota archaeon]